MNSYQLVLKCSCGFEEVLTVMEENGIQIHIGSSDLTEDGIDNSKLVLDCKKCGAKLSLEIIEKVEPIEEKKEDVPEEICNQG